MLLDKPCRLFFGVFRRFFSGVVQNLAYRHADDFSQMSTDFNSDKAKAGTGRRSLSLVLSPKAQIFTLEVSFYGYKTHEDTPIVPYSENRYRQLGSSIGKTLLDYYT